MDFKAFTDVTSLAIVAFVVYMIFAKILPDITKRHTDNITTISAAHIEAIKTQNLDCRDELKTVRLEFLQTLNAQRHDFLAALKEQNSLVSFFQTELLKDKQDNAS